MDRWTFAFYALAGVSISLFFLQGVFWSALRMKKLKVPQWQRLARWWLRLGVAVLVTGACLHLFAEHPSARAPAMAGLIGGGFNAFVASFHLRVISYLSLQQRRK